MPVVPGRCQRAGLRVQEAAAGGKLGVLHTEAGAGNTRAAAGDKSPESTHRTAGEVPCAAAAFAAVVVVAVAVMLIVEGACGSCREAQHRVPHVEASCQHYLPSLSRPLVPVFVRTHRKDLGEKAALGEESIQGEHWAAPRRVSAAVGTDL